MLSSVISFLKSLYAFFTHNVFHVSSTKTISSWLCIHNRIFCKVVKVHCIIRCKTLDPAFEQPVFFHVLLNYILWDFQINEIFIVCFIISKISRVSIDTYQYIFALVQVYNHLSFFVDIFIRLHLWCLYPPSFKFQFLYTQKRFTISKRS